MKSFLNTIIGDIVNFFTGLTAATGLTYDALFFIGIGIELLLVLFFMVKSSFAYEVRLTRSTNKLNNWLYHNQFINESNLLDFNARIKKAPKLIRYHWQQFMLYREKSPSEYLSVYNCIEKPLHTSSFMSNIKSLNMLSIAFSVLMFTISLAYYSNVQSVLSIQSVVGALILPILILILNTFFIMLLKARRSSNLNDMYKNFHLFSRFIDKAATQLPEYVDFEILFTKDEIKKGIPVLNEYLEKRARLEKEALEKARHNAVEHEKYDFSKAGIDGGLVIERAMKESEVYINVRQRLFAEIEQLSSEIESFKKNYDNTQREFQRKMQASKENLDRLREQQEEATNKIDQNYLKKQQGDEIKKQEQLEKDYDDLTKRFTQEVSALKSEIEKRNKELVGQKKNVEDSMLKQYQTFAAKLYDDVEKVAEGKVKQDKEILKNKNNELTDKIEFLTAKIKSLNVETVKPEQSEKSEQNNGGEGYYDELGFYRYPNGSYYDPNGIYFDETGGYFDKDGSYHAKGEPKEVASAKETIAVIEKFGVIQSVEEDKPKKQAEKAEIESQGIAVESNLEEPISEIVPEVKREKPAADVAIENVKSEEKKRGRPKKEIAETEGEKRAVGRPKKEKDETEKPKRAVGRPKKNAIEVEEKRAIGRPKKTEELSNLNRQIENENKILAEKRDALNYEINQNLENEDVDFEEVELTAIKEEIDNLTTKANAARDNGASDGEIAKINNEMSELLEKLNNLKNK